MIELEWDEAKRRINLAKHGLDFADALEFDWSDPIRWLDAREDYCEERFCALGVFRGLVHSVAYTIRDSNIRIISFRKAGKREVRPYEKEKGL